MSVKKTDRHDGELVHIAKAREAAEYVMHISDNENVFPKRARYTVVNKLQTMCLDLVACTAEAEEILPSSVVEYELKHSYMEKAQGLCRGILAVLDLSAKTYKVAPNRMEYATKLLTDARIKILSRMKVEEDKYKKYRV